MSYYCQRNDLALYGSCGTEFSTKVSCSPGTFPIYHGHKRLLWGHFSLKATKTLS